MSTMQARPTEYKGVRYRSKSEAMFARYLELEHSEHHFLFSHKGPRFLGGFNRGSGGFVYEPKGFDVDGWTPDFLSWSVGYSSFQEFEIPGMHYETIEYKPSKPTSAYIETFVSRCQRLVAKMLGGNCQSEFMNCNSFHVYYGSAFSECASGRVSVCTFGWNILWETDFDWIANYRESLLETRFDLENA
jgi:hypothetical protein